MRWQQINPINFWLVVKRDERQEATKGGILITEILPTAANLAYFTGTILKISDEALDYFNKGRVLSLTQETVRNYKVVYRQYLSEVISLMNKDEDSLPVFMMQAKDIIGLSLNTKISML